jgi:lipid A 3-O-deacylase
MWRIAMACLAISIWAKASHVLANDAHPWTGTFQLENDVLAPGNEDRWYTQGMRYTRMYPAIPKKTGRTDSRPPLSFLTDIWCTAASPCAGQGWAVGQLIFTPADITKAPDLRDRPWGGWLYMSGLAEKVNASNTRRTSLEVAIGAIGGSMSLAEWAQTELHKIIDSAEPAWNNNLKNELGIYVDYQVRHKMPLSSWADFVPHYGGNIGNVMTSAYVGGTVRVGCNMSDFGSQPHRPSGTVLGTQSYRPQMTDTPAPYGTNCFWDKLKEGYVFLFAEERIVGFNVFLDGNMFRDSPSVDREALVADVGLGFSLKFRANSGRDFRMSYTLVKRSKEFDVPMGVERDKQLFGSLVFSFELPL